MEENALINLDIEDIKDLIYTVRGKQVMLDSDVARLYHYKTKSLNLAVKRNIDRFPEEFCFQLTENEVELLRFQNETSKENVNVVKENRGGRRYLPYVFTEQGIAMLAGILRSEIAVKVSINIIKAFIEMRRFILSNGQIFERLTNIEYKLLDYDKRFNEVFNQLSQNENIKQKVFFEGQIYDSYNLIINIIKKANNKIIIIDNYIDDSVLEMLSKKKSGVEVVILTSNNSNIIKLDVHKFNKEYPTLKIAKTDRFHDRFIIIDGKELYHCGASLKDLGKKCFAISKIDDIEYLNQINKNVISLYN